MNRDRLELAALRGGDFAHAGEKESIEKVLSYIPSSMRGKEVLDIGCGLGGTAAHFYERGFKKITGIDLDKSAIDYAKKKYPHISFVYGDMRALHDFFPRGFFSLLYSFNALYNVKEKRKIFQECALVAKEDSLLVIFDYTGKTTELKDLAGNPIYPINCDTLESDLAATGWKLKQSIDLTTDFIRWYQELLKKIEDKNSSLYKTFSELLNHLEKGSLGGGLFIIS